MADHPPWLAVEDRYQVGILTRSDGVFYVPFYPDRDLDFLPKESRHYLATSITDFKPTSSEGNVTAVILAGWFGKAESQEDNATFALVVQQRGGYSERVGCFMINEKENFRRRDWYFGFEMLPTVNRISRRRQILRIR